jgi:hypothetical protein
MSKHSEYLRDQARRAERLALTVCGDEPSAKLKDLSRQFDADAERLERGGETGWVDISGRLQV